MRLTSLGHAGFILEAGGKRILIDPWFFPAFLESWFPYPDNRFLLSSVKTQRFDFLYISHLHEDHLDHLFLSGFEKSTPVLLPNYRSRSLGKKLASMGFRNLIPFAHRQSRGLAPGLTATMLLDTSHKEDSGLLVEYEGRRFLDLNDCNTALSELPTDVDLLAAQYSGAMWYPNCYEYDDATMVRKAVAVRSDLMKSLFHKCKTTGAKAYLPCAGPPCFLDPALWNMNDRDSTIFPVWENVAVEFRDACPEIATVTIESGDSIEIPGLEIDRFDGDRPSSEIPEYSERRRSEWGRFYERPEPAIQSSDIRTYFGRLQEKNSQLAAELDKYIRVNTEDRSWGVRLGQMADNFVIEGEDPYPPEYVLIMSSRILRAVLTGETGWEEALLSLRVRLRREPDVFDSHFMGLLRYGNEPTQTRQMAGESARPETIERDGLRMQRFCPHAGEDLMTATICGGVIECPRHHWKWDAKTGACIEGGSLALRVKPIPETPGQPVELATEL